MKVAILTLIGSHSFHSTQTRSDHPLLFELKTDFQCSLKDRRRLKEMNFNLIAAAAAAATD